MRLTDDRRNTLRHHARMFTLAMLAGVVLFALPFVILFVGAALGFIPIEAR
jgi:hypothetical protein